MPTTSPATAYFLGSPRISEPMHKRIARGGPDMMRSPTRAPSGDPHLKPGKPIMLHRTSNHGIKDIQNPILPI